MYCSILQLAVLVSLAHEVYGATSTTSTTTVSDEPVPAGPDDEITSTPIIAGLMADNVGEVYNFLDGDSFGIGPMHEFVYGWQSIVNSLSLKNNVEVRKRAGLQRFALAGINGMGLISHIGVTEIMINGTRTFCFGGVFRPPGKRNIFCKGSMYQEGRFNCRTPYLRYPTNLGYYICIEEFAVVKSLDGTHKKAACLRGETIPKFHYDYMCERREVRVRRLNLSDAHERYNIREPVVRRVEYYRSPYDLLKQCLDWYGCNFEITSNSNHEEINFGLLQGNETAFVGHGGKYWLALYYSKLSSWAVFFQAHGEYPWQTNKPGNDKESIWEQVLRANIGPDMNIHYNLNGIYNRYPNVGSSLDLMRNDGQVQPANMRQDMRDNVEDTVVYPKPGPDPSHFIHDTHVLAKFSDRMQ